jgi:predicted Ser/Thr protein kinase
VSRIPQHIDKYRILEQIAEGGMGVIYKAEHPTLGRPVILKRLTFAGGEDAAARFRREARIMMSFRNDAIVDVHDHFRSGSSWYIVMEYVDGMSLDALIRARGSLPSETALLILLECARALKYAHEKGVVHRDVKPSNILISRKGEVKLTDFGIATARDEEGSTALTSTGVTLGTVAYMSPEQIESSRDVDKRSDIYSLGVMLYEMVAGKAPFPSSFSPQTLAMIQRGRFRPVGRACPRVSPLVKRIVRRTIRPSPRRRFQDLGALLRLLERGLRFTDSPGVQRALGAWLDGKGPGSVTRRISPGIPAAAAVAAAALLAAAAYAAGRDGVAQELLLAGSYGALTVEIDGATVAKPRVQVYRGDSNEPLATPALRGRDDSWVSRRIYLPAGSYRATVEVDGLLAWSDFLLEPRELQRRSPATSDGYRLELDASGGLAALRLPVEVALHVVDVIDRSDLTAGTSVDVKIGDGWSPLSPETLARVKTGSTYSFRFERPRYYPLTSEVRIAPHEALLRLEAALAPLPAAVRIAATPAGVRLDGSSRYLSGERFPVYRDLASSDASARELLLVPGAHRIGAERGDLGSASLDIYAEPGERVSITIEAVEGKLAMRRFP